MHSTDPFNNKFLFTQVTTLLPSEVLLKQLTPKLLTKARPRELFNRAMDAEAVQLKCVGQCSKSLYRFSARSFPCLDQPVYWQMRTNMFL